MSGKEGQNNKATFLCSGRTVVKKSRIQVCGNHLNEYIHKLILNGTKLSTSNSLEVQYILLTGVLIDIRTSSLEDSFLLLILFYFYYPSVGVYH